MPACRLDTGNQFCWLQTPNQTSYDGKCRSWTLGWCSGLPLLVSERVRSKEHQCTCFSRLQEQMLWQAHWWRLALILTVVILIRVQVAGAIASDGGAGPFPSGGLLSRQSKPPTFLLFRLIGNNMPPLQSPGQLLWNTEYALKHEADFPDCRKRWVINQIVNTTEKQLILDLLKLHGYGNEDILVRELDYDQLVARPEADWEVFVTAQNQGRNEAIENGKAAGATWILPFDGNHFITNQAWRRIVRSASWSIKAGHQYFKVGKRLSFAF